VTLWKDGEVVYMGGGMVGNPQISRLYSNEIVSDEQLAEGWYQYFGVYPGYYTVMAEKDGYKSSPVTVTIADYAWLPPGPPMSTNIPIVSDRPKPTPTAGILTLLLSMALAVAYIHKSKN
jgi:hypothetical protein